MAIQSVVDLVNSGTDFFHDIATTAIDQTNGYLQQLTAFTYTPPAFDITLDTSFITDPGFAKPPSPVAPEVTVEFGDAPSDVDIQDVEAFEPGAAPTFDTPYPDVQIPSPPDPPLPTSPGEAPDVGEVEIPVFVEPTIPTTPSLFGLTLPAVPTVTVPTFSESIPDLVLEPPAVGFVFNEDFYTSTFLDDLRTAIRRMLDGGTGLPAAVEQALFERARSRADATARADMETVIDEWAARGFTLPAGEVSWRLAQARERNRVTVTGLLRDNMVQVHQAALEQLKAAVASGVQLEGEMITYAAGFADRALRAAIAVVEATVSLFNAQVALFNARLARVNAAIAVFQGQLQGELAKIEIYKGQLEGQALVGQLNEQQVRIYTAQLQVVSTLVEVFKAKIEAVQAQVDVDKTRIEAYRATVEAYGAAVQNKKAEFDAYSAQVQAEATKVGAYEASARAFAALVQGFEASTRAGTDTMRAKIEGERLKVEAFRANVEAYLGRVQGETGRVRAAADVFGGQAQLYSAEVGAESARTQIVVQAAQIAVEASRAAAAIASEQVRASAEVGVQAANLSLESIRAGAATAAHLAAGAMTACNVSAGLGGTDSTSTNYSLVGDSPSPPAA